MIKSTCIKSLFLLLLYYGDSMNIAEIIKKQTTIVAIAVILIITLAIGVSYALFFNIKEGEVQTVKAGTLAVTFKTNGTSADATSQQIEPMSDENGLKTKTITYTPENTGNLPVSYKLYLVITNSDTIQASYIKFSVDGNDSNGITAQSLSSKPSFQTDESYETNIQNKTAYEIDSGTIKASTSGQSQQGATKYLRVWLDESTFPDNIETTDLNLSILVVNEVDESSVTQ